MNEQIKEVAIQEALKRTDLISGKIEKLSVDVWNILVHQGHVAAAIAGIEILGLLTIKGLLIWALLKYGRPGADGDTIGMWFGWLSGILMLLVLTYITTLILPTFFTGWLNPEFWAIQTILLTAGVK